MGRPLRVDQPGQWHQVYNRGARGQPIFLNDDDRLHFLYLLGVITHRWNIEIHAYALMTNHFHLLVHCPDGNLSPAMQYLFSNYVRAFNKRHGFDGPLFRGRFEDTTPDGDGETALHLFIQNEARYAHRNPLDIQRDLDLALYEWSSYPAYVGAAQGEWWLKTEQIAKNHESPDQLRKHTETQLPRDKTTINPSAQTAHRYTDPEAAYLVAVRTPTMAPTIDDIYAATESILPERCRTLARVFLARHIGHSAAAIADRDAVGQGVVWERLRQARKLAEVHNGFVAQLEQAHERAWGSPDAPGLHPEEVPWLRLAGVNTSP